MTNNNNTRSGSDELSNVMSGRQPSLRSPMPETTAKLLNGSPGPQERPQGRPILGAQVHSQQASPHQTPQVSQPPQVNSAYPNQVQQPPQRAQIAVGTGLSIAAPEYIPGQAHTSSLSAHAKEFVPRHQQSVAYNSTPQYSDTQYQLLSAGMPQYNDGGEILCEQLQRLMSIQPPQHSNVTVSNSSIALQHIENAVYYLTTNPSQVESYMVSVVSELQQLNPDGETINKIAECLIEQGISEPNFRYTGAKICQFLAINLKLPDTQGTFRQMFLKRFQQEHSKKDEWVKDPNFHERLCGLTLFLGELFLNMEIEKAGSTQKMIPLRKALKELLLTLLSTGTEATVKCACQLLKLTGAAIQDTEPQSDQNPQSSYDDVFFKLQKLSQDSSLSTTASMLISSVLQLRETNWGRRESSSDSSQDPSLATWDGLSYGLNEPIFYDNNGQPISREQAGFYVVEGEEDFSEYPFDAVDTAYQPWANDDTNYDPYDGYVLSANDFNAVGGMDEEMEAAYEEFLKSQGQS